MRRALTNAIISVNNQTVLEVGVFATGHEGIQKLRHQYQVSHGNTSVGNLPYSLTNKIQREVTGAFVALTENQSLVF